MFGFVQVNKTSNFLFKYTIGDTNELFLESENSVPSWASSISLDSQTEEAIVEFMRKFVSVLFEDSSTISLDIKSEFGLKTRVGN